ncbi:epidermal growth factor receptor-like isoform X2 [Rhinoderma darwinii]|uniref:epidermal growth factor receptor-like isoform X2 n=1 Tax=Rhinoderma darwinii TaxID=43563 RepID=UPI003F66B365
MKAFGLDLKHQRLSVLLAVFLLFIIQSCNAEVDRKVCLGTNYKFLKLGTADENYSLLKEIYSGCEVVLGNLEITHLQPHQDTSFLKDIQEVGGYVLIAANLVKSIPLLNLRIIRGNILYKNSALSILYNFIENDIAHGLEELPMRQLREILQGGVTIAGNPRLCNLDTIKWKDIVRSGSDLDINHRFLPHCPICIKDCNGSCWGSGPENCQILTKLICTKQCSGRCRGPSPGDCCHSQCAAGCTGPKETDCLACLKFRDGDTCLERCPQDVPKKYSFGSSCVEECPHKKSDWFASEKISINDVLKEQTYILTIEKETINVTSKLDRPKLQVFNTTHDKKVCTGTANYLSQMSTPECHYNMIKRIYQGCEIVLGNLEITYLQPNFDVSIFKDIQEVRGCVIIAVNSVKSIPLENLRVIRGETLFGNASLTIVSNYKYNSSLALEEVPMRQLQEIIRGGVRIINNPKLCMLDTIKWEDIVHSNYSIIVEKGSRANCSECDMKACNGSCWGPGPENCQILTKITCDQTCPGRCRGPKPSDCCDRKCAAGCKGPKETDCLACKLVRDNHEKCLEYCPPLQMFNLETHPVHSKVKENSCVIKCPVNYMVTDSGTCVQKCSKGSYMVEEYGILRCIKCDGPCPEGKICHGNGYGKLKDAFMVNASNIDDFENCTIVLGNVVIIKQTILGDRYTNASAMDPSKLNILKSIREITGYLMIQWWPENYTNLSIFKNLEIIRGRPKYDWKYALVVIHTSISSLGLKSLKEVGGNVVIKDNKDLCYSDTINWTRIIRTNQQQKPNIRNKSLEECVAEGKNCDPSCSDDGCWGPGPSQCLS